jgi:MoaA/NifB/PqqE/SkfB family radical SAM enzyme
LTINVTISKENVGQVEEIVDYCTREYSKARVWLNPVVVGNGKLRTDALEPAPPDYLWTVKSPTLLTTEFFRQGVKQHYETGRLDWGCKAGRFFFDINPNGDFWICQDYPAKTPLNILDRH